MPIKRIKSTWHTSTRNAPSDRSLEDIAGIYHLDRDAFGAEALESATLDLRDDGTFTLAYAPAGQDPRTRNGTCAVDGSKLRLRASSGESFLGMLSNRRITLTVAALRLPLVRQP